MSQSYYPITFNQSTGELETDTFNTYDFEANYEAVTVVDLQNYAHKYHSNVFTNTNYFSDIFVNSINSVNDTVLDYLSTITENVQDKLTFLYNNIIAILGKTTNINYYDSYDMTTITNNVKMERLTVENNVNVKSLIVSSHINANQINNQSMISRTINTEQLYCQNIRCKTIISSSDIGVYLYYNNQTIPIQKSQALSNIMSTINSPFNCTVTIKQNYKIVFMDAHKKRILQIRNDFVGSNDFLYNQKVELTQAPYLINLYFEDMLFRTVSISFRS
jgi:hypothetical protein